MRREVRVLKNSKLSFLTPLLSEIPGFSAGQLYQDSCVSYAPLSRAPRGCRTDISRMVHPGQAAPAYPAIVAPYSASSPSRSGKPTPAPPAPGSCASAVPPAGSAVPPRPIPPRLCSPRRCFLFPECRSPYGKPLALSQAFSYPFLSSQFRPAPAGSCVIYGTAPIPASGAWSVYHIRSVESCRIRAPEKIFFHLFRAIWQFMQISLLQAAKLFCRFFQCGVVRLYTQDRGVKNSR